MTENDHLVSKLTEAALTANHAAARVRVMEAERDLAVEDVAALRARVAELEAAIKFHNDGCAAACASRDEARYCDAFTSRGRPCVDCPKFDMIECPGPSAPTAHNDGGPAT
jgi:hypothetical protein